MTPGSYVDAARLLVGVGFVGWQVVVMGAIGYAESNLRPHAINLNDHDSRSPWFLSMDWGVWQINDAANQSALIGKGVLTPLRAVSQQLLDPVVNVKAARYVFVSRGGERDPLAGYSGWSAFKSGAYAQYKPAALKAARTIGVPV
jgi:hypothetical protein